MGSVLASYTGSLNSLLCHAVYSLCYIVWNLSLCVGFAVHTSKYFRIASVK